MSRELFHVLGGDVLRGPRASRRARAFQAPASVLAWGDPEGPADPVPWLGAATSVRVLPIHGDEPHTYGDIGDAYDALSDPRAEAHPLPEHEPAFARLSLLRDFERVGPSAPDVFDRFVRSFTGRHAGKSHSLQALQLDLVVSPEQALVGGTLTIGIPTFAACPACGGSGRDSFYLCTGCNGRGVVAAERPVAVRVPARLRDGDTIDVALFRLGVDDQSFSICFRVGG